MNQTLKISITFLLMLLIGVSCQKPPEWNNTPELLAFDYKNFDDSNYVFHPKKNGVKPAADSIILSVNFQDGDANLGLESFDTLSPYNTYDIIEENGSPKLKPVGNPFNIYEHILQDINDNDTLDTLMIRVNELANNFLVDFIEYDLLGKVKDTLDFKTFVPGGIQNFNGRFMPLFKKDFSENIYDGPLEGTINYTMTSVNFPSGIWRFRVRIVDRDLNISNAILSPEITIE